MEHKGSNSGKIKVLYFVPIASAIGGADRALIYLIQGLDPDYYEVTVVLPEEGDYLSLYQALPVKIKFLQACTIERFDNIRKLLSSAARLPRSVLTLVKIIRREGIDVLHTQKINSLDGVIAARLTGIASVQSIHENPAPPLWLWQLLSSIIYALNDQIIVSCDETSRQVPALNPSRRKISKIHNGIDLTAFQDQGVSSLRVEFGIPDTAKVVGVVSRLAPSKGIEYFLQAIPQILALHSDVYFMVVGDTTTGSPSELDYNQSLHSLVRDLGVASQVIFTGTRQDIVAVLQAIDIFVHPAKADILPVVIMQAMAMARPVVATHVGGIPEEVDDRVTGILVPPGDSLALAEAIMRLLESPDLRQSMGRAGKRRCEQHFSISQYVQEIQRVYHQILLNK